ncbi:RNA polymerase sigma factor [Catellatospora methionotrophica]|uniref:RNA polymerase sigma factor n=1 Tax=Catellatospora methionotrophica TaxID=121620 RepID=UPI0033EE2D39
MAPTLQQANLEGQFMAAVQRAIQTGHIHGVTGSVIDVVNPRSDRMTVHVADEWIKPMVHSLTSAIASPAPKFIANGQGGIALCYADRDQPAIQITTGSRKDWTRALAEVSGWPAVPGLADPVELNRNLLRPGEDGGSAARLFGSALLRSANILKDDQVAQAALTFAQERPGGVVEWFGPQLPPLLMYPRLRASLWGVLVLPPPSMPDAQGQPQEPTGPGGPAAPWQPVGDATGVDPLTGIDWSQLRRDGEPIWFDALVRHFHPKLVLAAVRMSGCQLHDARDLANDTLVTAWARRGGVRDNPAPWLYTTLRYNVYNRHRTRLRRPTEYIELDTVQATQADVADLIADRSILDQAMARLSDEDRLLMLAYFFDRVSYPELAECYGITVPTARKRIERVLKRLRRIVDEMGGYA